MSTRVYVGVIIAYTVLNPSILYSADSTATLQEGSWHTLFNGRNYDGWYRYLDRQGKNNDPQNVFQINDGMLTVYRDHRTSVPAEAGYLASEDEYSYYHLRFEYKWGKKKFSPRSERPRDAGLIYHFVGSDQVWPRGIECQIQEGDTGDCYLVNGARVTTTAAPYAANGNMRRYRNSAAGGISRTFGSPSTIRIAKDDTHERPEGWNVVEVIVEGSERVTHIVNGHVNFQATDLRQIDEEGNWQPLTHGRILLQAEYAQVSYRNVEIRPLAGKPFKALPPEATISFRVPDGFEVFRVAASPLVEYPTLACLDERGRLYVSEGAGINAGFEELEKTLPRSIRRLEDIDEDGIYDRTTVFADKMTFPYGGTYYNGALYVASPPNIWRLEDTDDDGIADRREILVSGFRSNGLSSDMKGPYLAPDGWFYFCGGNEGGYDLRAADDRRLQDPRSSPAVFRIRPDGTQLEYFAHGGAGVYDLSFDPTGDLFGIVTIMKYPRGDGLINWVYGGTYPSSRPLSRQAHLTGDRLPPMRDWGQTSPSGSMRYDGTSFGEAYRGNLFTAHFNTHTVTRDVIQRKGGSWEIKENEAFLASEDPYCFLTDVLEDSDGSLLVVDTGSWFHIGCPLSPGSDRQLTGGIYRICKSGALVPDDPRGTKIDWNDSSADDLVALLDDPRFVVRDRAIASLATGGIASISALREALAATSVVTRRNSTWALNRIDAADARTAIRDAVQDSDASVSQAAIHSAGLWRDVDSLPQLLAALRAEQPSIRREAAGAIGRLGNVTAIPALFDAVANEWDRFAEHAIVYALIELDAGRDALAALGSQNAKRIRAALIVLEAIPHSPLTEEHVASLLSSTNREVQRAALQVALTHRKWIHGVPELLQAWLTATDLDANDQAVLAEALVARHNEALISKLIFDTLSDGDSGTAPRLLMLDVLSKAFAKLQPSPAVVQSLQSCLADKDKVLVEAAITVVASVGRHQLDADLESLVANTDKPLSSRLAAGLACLDRRNAPRPVIFEFLTDLYLASSREPLTRITICRGLADSQLSTEQQIQLTDLVAVAGPVELPLLLGAFAETTSTEVGQALAHALLRSTATGALPPGCVERLFSHYPGSVKKLAAPLDTTTTADRKVREARLEEIKVALEGGNAERGHDVFFHKSSCFACHRVGTEGSSVGPELTKISDVRTRRELLEAVVFPSATFARGFEPSTVVTLSGRVHSGIIRRASRDSVALLTPERSERLIPRDEIEEIVACNVSIMPQGLDRALSQEDLRDLMAFLSSLKSHDENDSESASSP